MKAWYVDFTAEGLNMARLLRQAGEQGMALRGVRRVGDRKMSGLVREDQLGALEALAEKGGWRFTRGRRHGGGRLITWLGKRWTLAACVAAALILTAVCSQLMWRVELRDAGTYEGDLRGYLREAGIGPICRKSDVDTSALRDALEWRYPRVAWVECGWRGVTLVIRMVEGVPAGETLTCTGAGDVVAARDGLVDSIVTLAGTPQVKAGEFVRAGQVLILGEERTSANGEEPGVRPVSARGTVTARVWDGATIRMDARRRETVYSGRMQEAWNVRCPWFSLWSMADSGFAGQDASVRELPLGGLFFPLIYRVEERMEATVRTVPADRAQLEAEAGIAALRALRKKIGSDDDLVDKWVEYCMIEDEQMEATAIGERCINIGVRQRGDAS